MPSAYWQKGVGKVRKEISKGKHLEFLSYYMNNIVEDNIIIVEDIVEQPPIKDLPKFKDLQMYIM